MQQAAAEAQKSWVAQAQESGSDVLYLQGDWRLANLTEVDRELKALPLEHKRPCILDGSRLRSLDTATSFTLIRRLDTAGYVRGDVSPRNVQPHHERLLKLVHDRMTVAPCEVRPAMPGKLAVIGHSAFALASQLGSHTQFLGQVAIEMFSLLRRPRLFRIKETVSQFETSTLNAVPIIMLVTLLIGVVFAYLLGTQAQRYGASIFVVDGVGIAICRELAPMLVAIIVAGRSGAAFTAQIGSMKVQEETDAIQTLGLSPVQVLVIPRLVAIAVGLPLLVFLGDVAGIAGGMFISALQLDIAPGAFVRRLHQVLPLSALVIGLVKAPVFATFIALIGCRMGLSVERDSRSVGDHTTSTVVQGIVWVIVLNAIFAVILQQAGV